VAGVVALVSVSFLAQAGRNGDFAIDLRHAFLPAASRVLHGDSPFPAPDDPVVEAREAYAYPPLTAVALAPVSGAPRLALEIAIVALLAAALIATLWLLEVRDVRCYAAALVWGPVLAALQTANLTLLLGLGLALVWRWRDRAGRGSAATALALAPKIFLWPVAVWGLATRRFRAMVTGLALALAVTAVTWAVIGFAGLREYPRLARNLSRAEQDDAVTVYALARALGLGGGPAWGLWALAGVSVLAACVLAARTGRERSAFALAIAASLLLTPIVWLHYFAILVVPLAIARPVFDASWLLPVVLMGASGTGNGGVAKTVVVLAVSIATVWASLTTRRPADRDQPVARRKTTTDVS
jgi:hypothetical protein